MATKWDEPQNKASQEDPAAKLEAIKDLENRETIPVHSPIFDTEALELLCRRDLPAALRQLADHLERKEICQPVEPSGKRHVQNWRRAHF